jgi:hypothetical protein
MGVMTLQTFIVGKMIILAGIMAVCTGWDNTLFPGWMFSVTFGTGKVLKMGCTVVSIVLRSFFMTGCTKFSLYVGVPLISSGLMGLMTAQTVGERHFRCMLIVAVKTGLILTFGQTVSVMTGGTVLFSMSTG